MTNKEIMLLKDFITWQSLPFVDNLFNSEDETIKHFNKWLIQVNGNQQPMRDATEEERKSVKDYSQDCISREAVLDLMADYDLNMGQVVRGIHALPSVKPKYTDEEIARAQAVEQAYVDKMVELAVEETKRPKGKWIKVDDEEPIAYDCSECSSMVSKKYNYCPECGADMSGGEERCN